MRKRKRRNDTRDKKAKQYMRKSPDISVHRWLDNQAPVRVGPRKKHGEATTYGDNQSHILSADLPDNQTSYACHLPQIQRDGYKKWKWNGKIRLACNDVRYSSSKISVGLPSWILLSLRKWPRPSRQTGESNDHNWLSFRGIWSVEQLEALPEGKNQSYQWPKGGRCKIRQKLTFCCQRARQNSFQSGQLMALPSVGWIKCYWTELNVYPV